MGAQLPSWNSTISASEESYYIKKYVPLVRKIVKQFPTNGSGISDPEDIYQLGMMGLLAALRKYGKPDEHFIGYAVTRIRGSIIDQLRKDNWLPRGVSKKIRNIEAARNQLEQAAGKSLCASDVAKKLNMDIESYQEYALIDHLKSLESLDNVLQNQKNQIIEGNGDNTEHKLILQDLLAKAIDSLQEREQVILHFYYCRHMSLKEIAEVLNITEVRVCQIHVRIVKKIKEFFDNS